MEQWSPDGKWLVYSDWKHLFLVSPDGGAPQKLTPDGELQLIQPGPLTGRRLRSAIFQFRKKCLGSR